MMGLSLVGIDWEHVHMKHVCSELTPVFPTDVPYPHVATQFDEPWTQNGLWSGH